MIVAMRSLLSAGILLLATASIGMSQTVTKYVRFTTSAATAPAWGVIDGDMIHELRGEPFAGALRTPRRVRIADARLLAPIDPVKVIAVGLNYKSHLGERPPAAYPGLFAKYPTSIIPSGTDILLPEDATNTHYEGEMVLVIGKQASNVSVADAKSYIFGVTVGNDVSERDWQRADLQWFRAKASDGFGPVGPYLVTGVNYDDLLLQTRLNGQVVQSQRTKDLIFNSSEIVSYISRYVTLNPGDVIFTGTPGTTRQMKAGDVVEVELENVGVVRNKVTQVKKEYAQHATDRPQPLPLAPPAQTLPVPAPAGAVMLFDGTSLTNWRSADSTRSPARWKVENGYLEVVRGSGDIESAQSFGDGQLHVEFMSPKPATGEGQDRGNSGVFLMSKYEVQVLDSYANVTYPDGQAAAIYGQFAPRVNVSRPPGEWQTLDITFTAPRFDAAGKLVSPARMTVLHNGVNVQDNVALLGPTTHRRRDPYAAHPDRLPVKLQDHGHPVRFRNIWIVEKK
jgi:2-keto-4-pentenoate hydratase/2-oxohepta-3-ene-1,7-dioic acid hydratase in catechol pathway